MVDNNNFQIKIRKRDFLSKYDLLIEKLAKKAGEKIKVKIKDKGKIQEFEKLKSEIHLDISLSDLYSLSYLSLIVSIILGIIGILIINKFLVLVFFLLLGLLLYQFFLQYPTILRNKLRAKKRDQLINLILLIAIKLRSNQNLETALEYSLKYIKDPLRYDIERLLWDTYNKKYYNIIDALDTYIKNWEDEAPFFTYGMQLLISSIYESDNERKEAIIDKAIETTLDVLYDRLSITIRTLYGPINLTYMLGIMLPTLMLTIFPLSSILLPDIFGSRFLFSVFDIFVPITILLIVKGFIEGKGLEFISNIDPEILKIEEKNKRKYSIIAVISTIIFAFIILFIGVFVIGGYIKKIQLASVIFAAIFILALGLSIGMGFKTYYNFLRNIDTTTENINKELSSFLFSLSIRLRDNVPLENAIIDIYPKFRKKYMGKFLAELIRAIKIKRQSVLKALFDEKNGIIKRFPSSYLKLSMETIVENSEINPYFASKTAIAMYKYFVYIERVNMKLQDLIAEVVSQMKMLARLVGPLILGIITGMTIMSINIMYNLGVLFENIKGFEAPSGDMYGYTSFAGEILNVFSFNNIMTPATIYIIVGIYNILISIVIAYILNIIENGKNPIKEKKYISDYVIRSTIVYVIVGSISSVLLWIFSNKILSGIII